MIATTRIAPAMVLLARLQEPGNFNKTNGPKFIGKVEEVKSSWPTRKATTERPLRSRLQEIRAGPRARSLQHRRPPRTGTAGQREIPYGEEAYNETRSRALWQVQKGWEKPVRQYGDRRRPIVRRVRERCYRHGADLDKLNTIIIPRIEFRDASIREAIDFLRQQAAANDPAAEGRKGVDIVLRVTQMAASRAPNRRRPRQRAAASCRPG